MIGDQFITVAVTHASGQVSRVQILSRCALQRFSVDAAIASGYRQEGNEWVFVNNPSNIGRAVHAQQYPTHVNVGGGIGEDATFVETGPVVSWRVVQPEDFPDADYKNAWVDDGVTITHDKAQSRELCRQHVRYMRETQFKRLDGSRAQAVREGNFARIAEIDAEAQRWADAPADPRIEAAQSVAELKAITFERSR